MTGEHLYTLKEIAKELAVNESTVRYWRDTFSKFIPAVTHGRRKYYRSDALDTLRFIRDLSHDRSYSAAQIKDELSRHAPIEGQYEKVQRSNGAAQNQRSNEGHELAPQGFVDKLLERVQGLLSTQDQRMAALETENRELRERLARLEEQQKTAAPQQQRSAIAAASSRDQTVAYLIRLRSEGLSYRAIANRLNSEGIQGLRGGIWDGKTVSRILRKEGIE